jgi:hypothetical protein
MPGHAGQYSLQKARRFVRRHRTPALVSHRDYAIDPRKSRLTSAFLNRSAMYSETDAEQFTLEITAK